VRLAVRRDFGNSSLLGKRAVVVGATSGIGEGIALRLAQANCEVTVVGRDQASLRRDSAPILYAVHVRWPTQFAMLFATSIEDCGEMLGSSFFRPAPFKGRWHLLDRKCGSVPKSSLHDVAKDTVWAKTKALLNSIQQQ
jgi:hypothetical protein